MRLENSINVIMHFEYIYYYKIKWNFQLINYQFNVLVIVVGLGLKCIWKINS